MSARMFLDDEREPPRDGDGWVVVRSVGEALAWMDGNGCPSFVSFDNDLGEGMPEGRELARAMVERDLDAQGGFIPQDFAWYSHTQNPVARDAIDALLRRWMECRPSLGQGTPAP